MKSRTMKLGTRKSLLAWAQSSWVAKRLEESNPGLQVELFGIETRGDRVLDVSLRQIEGKEFFVAELDDALKSGQVDLTVHSMKDLSLERPKEFVLAGIPKRANPRDVVLFSPQIMERLYSGQSIRIGTSSPRRIENIPGFLKDALPWPEESHRPLEFVEIRGNVNTRLSRVQEPTESAKYLDAVVLAFAGLIRLWADPAGQTELKKLLQGVRWMVLPLKECPTAPAQGALAIECRADDSLMRECISKIHDSHTASHVARERQVLSDWGGGCHQKFGATSVSHSELEHLFYIKGRKPDETYVESMDWNRPELTTQNVKEWDGSLWRTRLEESNSDGSVGSVFDRSPAVFIAHSRAAASAELQANTRVWTSGTSSWFKLAEKGYWVEGSAEGLGFDSLLSTLQEEVLRLPKLENWSVLTHTGAVDDWKKYKMTAIGTYELPGRDTSNPFSQKTFNQMIEELKNATHVYWSSSSQFDLLKEHIQEGQHHACGPGKTAEHLRKAGLTDQLVVFPSRESWKLWTQK